MSKLNYSFRRVKLPRREAPPLRRMLMVYQNGFGYFNGNNERYGALGTHSQATCVELFLRNTGRNLSVLAHLSMPPLDHFTLLNQMMSFLIRKRVIEGITFDRVEILTNILSNGEAIRRVFYTLKVLGLEPEVIRCFFPMHNDLLIGGEGELLRTKYSRNAGREVMPPVKEIKKISKKRKLFCDNDGEMIEAEQPIEIYQGVPIIDVRDSRSKGTRKRYAINMRVEDGFDPTILERVPQLEEVRTSLQGCPDGKYVRISTQQRGHLYSGYISNVQQTAFLVASQL